MNEQKYALLDTDFISKTYSVQKDMEDHLIDRILELPGYQFFCHHQIVMELSSYNSNAPQWLQKKLKEQEIRCFTDEDILDELEKFGGPFTCAIYTQMLKQSCDVFSERYFYVHYQALDKIDYISTSKAEYLLYLQELDRKIGKQNSLGEIKTYVLLQFLTQIFGSQVYIFCSDDKNARSGAINFDDVCCISVLSSFLRLKKELGWNINNAEPYITSLVDFYIEHHQNTFKVMEASAAARICKVSCRQVLEDIFQDKLVEMKNGMLRYK